jgi:hypothetical protein
VKITYKYTKADEMSGKCNMHCDIRNKKKFVKKIAGRKARNILEKLNVDGDKY